MFGWGDEKVGDEKFGKERKVREFVLITILPLYKKIIYIFFSKYLKKYYNNILH